MQEDNIAIFDIECDGRLESLSTVHSLVVLNKDGLHSFSPENIKQGVDLLCTHAQLVGHNIISYDLPALKKVYGLDWNGRVFDTLNISRLIFTNLFELDFSRKKIQKKLWGSHSLEAWGHRLGEHKGEYTGGWEKWSPEMQRYCEQDVRVTKKLYDILIEQNYSQRAIDLEHDFQKIIHRQELNGILFDVKKARELEGIVSTDLDKIKRELADKLPIQVKPGKLFTPKRDNKSVGYRKGCAFTKISMHEFNAGSRSQIIEFFKRQYGWEPTVFTDKNNPKLSDEIFAKLQYPEAKDFTRYFERIKIQGYLSTGKNAWLKLVKNGRIYGSVITNGAVTGRCTHSKPNIAQVPSVRKYLGKECRELFHAGMGWMVGADASGLELRMLAHYLYPYDGGLYAKEVTTGDVHSANQRAGEIIPTRDNAKTAIYCLIYGGGDAKLGSTITGIDDEEENKRAGKIVRANLMKNVKGLSDLISDVRRKVDLNGYLIGLDGRRLHVRSQHKALNTLLQGAGAIVMKQANINFWREPWEDVQQVINCHDEIQFTTMNKDNAYVVGDFMVDSIIKAGEDFNLNVELDGEFKVGKSWASTH